MAIKDILLEYEVIVSNGDKFFVDFPQSYRLTDLTSFLKSRYPCVNTLSRKVNGQDFIRTNSDRHLINIFYYGKIYVGLPMTRDKLSYYVNVYDNDDNTTTPAYQFTVTLAPMAKIAQFKEALQANLQSLGINVWAIKLIGNSSQYNSDDTHAIMSLFPIRKIDVTLLLKEEGKDDCVICLDNKMNFMFSCSHGLCSDCIKRVINSSCPICKHDFRSEIPTIIASGITRRERENREYLKKKQEEEDYRYAQSILF